MSVEKSADDGRLIFIYIFAKLQEMMGKVELSMHKYMKTRIIIIIEKS